MITPTEASRRIARFARPLPSETMAVGRALGHVLAEDVRAGIPLPGFDNSAMDGYAVRSDDTVHATSLQPVTLRVVETIFAGDKRRRRIKKGESCRIMTGAPLPRGADAVLPREDAEFDGGRLIVRQHLSRFRHVRRRGEEIDKGALVVRKGTWIHPGVVAALASVGRARVRIVPKPRVALITTGDEAVSPGARLAFGQIYDSNSPMMIAALRDLGIEPVRVRRIGDHYGALLKAIEAALERSDVLVVVGGVSVGDKDYLRRVLDDLGVKRVFWRVSQKPGKPLFFGRRGKRLVFGLPGNPSSSFTCFYVYVYPVLRQLAGLEGASIGSVRRRPTGEVTPDTKRWRFLKARMGRERDGSVEPLPFQGSHMVTSLVATDSLIVVPPRTVGKGQDFETLRLPYAEDEE